MQQSRGGSGPYFILLIGAVWLALIAGLYVFPLLYPPDPGLPNAAAMLGYSIPTAYLTFVGVALFFGLAIAFFGPAMASAAARVREPESPALLLWTERAALLSVIALVYWPPALARFGPHIEAGYFINVLWRIECGQVAYNDFEFLYGPLMIGLAEAWIALAGFSLQDYYTYYMLLQLVFFGVLLLVLQAHIRTPWKRYAALLVMLPFFFDILLGLNWMAWRFFLVPLMILVIAAGPQSRARALVVGCMIGVQAALSHEYSVTALATALALYGVQLFYRPRWRAMTAASIAAGTVAAVWIALAWASTGAAFSDYLANMVEVSARNTELGIAQFAFHWTAHSLALALVLCCGLALFSGSLRRLGRIPLSSGDYHLIGAIVFAGIAFRIVLQRADYLHMAVPFIPLILVILLNQPRSLLGNSTALHRVAIAAIAAAAVAHGAGHSFSGKWMLQNQARGIVQELEEAPVVGPFASRLTGIDGECSEEQLAMIALAGLLASPALAERPVLFYGSGGLWPPRVGVCPAGYSFYDLLYAEQRYPHARTVAENPGLLVVLPSRAYKQLLSGEAAEPALRQFTDFRQTLSWLTSPHYSQGYYENLAEFKMWRQSLGSDLVKRFQPVAEAGLYTVLERQP